MSFYIKEFDNLPEEWTTCSVSNIIELCQYGSSDSSDVSGSIPILGMKNIANGKVFLNDLSFISLSKEEIEKYKLYPGDILLNRTNSLDLVGKVALFNSNEVVVFASYLVRLRFKVNQIIPEFANYFLNSFLAKKQLSRITTLGVSQANINPTTFRKKVTVPIPPLKEQKKIIEILSNCDRAIELTQKLIASKQKLKQGLMQKILKLPGRTVKLENFLKPVVRKVPKPLKPYMALGIRSYGKGTFQRWVDDPNKVAMENLFQVKPGDLIVNITFAWEGAIAIVKREDLDCLVSHRFPTYTINENIVLTDFLRQLVTSKKFVFSLGTISPGGAGRNRVLNKKEFLKLRINLPHLSLQSKVAKLFNSVDKELEILHNYLNNLHQQKKGLMQQLLTGKTRVPLNQ